MVSPTRELAVQIYEQLVKLVGDSGIKVVCVYGGVPKDEQRNGLRTASIIVATPGRLNDFIQEGAADLSNVGYFVLDEADRMLDKGFEAEIKKIASTITAGKAQTVMFTATWPQSIRELAATFMKDPVRINIGQDNPTGDLRANVRVTQKVEVVDPRGKEQRLLALIKQYQSGKDKDNRILVFCLYKKEATRVEGYIASKGLRVAGIHGDLNQNQRSASLEAFKSGKVPLLVATDVAARGLDIPNVKLVINVTFPLTVEDYVHRIGRTGRAGQDGLAITLFTEHDKAQSGALINVLKAAKQPVPDELMKFGTVCVLHIPLGVLLADICFHRRSRRSRTTRMEHSTRIPARSPRRRRRSPLIELLNALSVSLSLIITSWLKHTATVHLLFLTNLSFPVLTYFAHCCRRSDERLRRKRGNVHLGLTQPRTR
jgi:ATP-dependent RNA helicase DBP3